MLQTSRSEVDLGSVEVWSWAFCPCVVLANASWVFSRCRISLMSDDLPGLGVHLFGRVTVQDLVDLVVESIVQDFLDLLRVSAILVFK